MDVFHPSTGEVRSDGADGIACCFIDTDYNDGSFFVRHAYFLGANDPCEAVRINHLGDEVLKVLGGWAQGRRASEREHRIAQRSAEAYMRRSTAKQHYAPRLLLRNWAGRTKLGERTLRVVPIDTRRAGLILAEETSIEWFAQDPDLFREATENTFSALEQKAGIAIQRVTQLVAGQDQASIDTNRITTVLRGLAASVLLRSARRREADTVVRELAHHVTGHAKEITARGTRLSAA